MDGQSLMEWLLAVGSYSWFRRNIPRRGRLIQISEALKERMVTIESRSLTGTPKFSRS